jgi:hypothetical protein
MRKPRFLSLGLVFAAIQILALLENSANAANLNPNYPRLANYYLASAFDQKTSDSLKKWDLLILNSDIARFDSSRVASIRSQNPNVVLLSYVDAMILVKRGASGFDRYYNSARLLAAEASGSPGWWLYNQNGDHVVRWPNTWSLNLSDVSPGYNGRRWSEYLADFVRDEIMRDYSWDGVFYDDAHQFVDWMNKGNLDLNNDRVKDNSSYINEHWSRGLQSLLERSKANLGPAALIVGNGNFNFYQLANGRMIENFPNYGNSDWDTLMGEYYTWSANAVSPRLIVINGNNGNNGDQFSNLKNMRFTLASTLLGDGYFSYDYGGKSHARLWWYDEYSVDGNGNATGDDSAKGYLGRPKGAAQRLPNGVWRRDFDRGVVLSNPTSAPQTMGLEKPYKKIRGGQAPAVNDGSVVHEITIPSRDGIILLGSTQEGASQAISIQSAPPPQSSGSNTPKMVSPAARAPRAPVSRSPITGEIVGSVVNLAGRPIEGVRVTIGASRVPTNGNGNFRFTKVHLGTYTIYYSIPGYGSRTQTIEVKVGTVVESAQTVLSWWRFYTRIR